MTLHVSGNGSRVIVWLHGFCISSEIWDDCLPHFHDDFKSVCVDLPGFGNSPFVSFGELPELGERLHSTLRQNGIEKAVLSGHSLGGYVSMEIARRHPEFCEALILFHSTPFPDSEDRKSVRQLYLDAFNRFGGDFFLKNFHEHLFYQKDKSRTEALRQKHAGITVETLSQYTAAMKNRTGYHDILTGTLPKLIIAGAFDKAIDRQEYLKMYEDSENSEFIMLSNSAHMGMMEESTTASNAIKSFLNNKVTL